VPVFFLAENHAITAYWGSGGISPLIVTSALDAGEWSASRHGPLSQRRQPLVPI
jgi:hypothetical protein